MKKNGGFTFIEVMFSMTILVIAVLGSEALVTTFASIRKVNEETATATIAARQKLDQIRSTTFTSILSTYNNQNFQVNLNGDTSNDLRAQTSDADGNVGKVIITQVGPTGNPSSLLQVEVTIQWLGVLGNRKYQIGALMSNRAGS